MSFFELIINTKFYIFIDWSSNLYFNSATLVSLNAEQKAKVIFVKDVLRRMLDLDFITRRRIDLLTTITRILDEMEKQFLR